MRLLISKQGKVCILDHSLICVLYREGKPAMRDVLRLKSVNSLRAKKGKRIVLIGLDGAGKTTILQQLISHEAAPDTLPTIGFTMQVLRTVNPGFTRGGQLRMPRAGAGA